MTNKFGTIAFNTNKSDGKNLFCWGKIFGKSQPMFKWQSLEESSRRNFFLQKNNQKSILNSIYSRTDCPVVFCFYVHEKIDKHELAHEKKNLKFYN